jgi:sulfate adenylyltransferase subunit 1 (EFTu-like GTPase family)
MAKIKSTITGTYEQVYKRIHRSEVCAGGAGDTLVHVQSNSRPLSALVESASVRETDRYDWKTGRMVKEKLDVISNAKRNINTPKIHPVTNARNYADDSRSSGMNMTAPCCEYGYGNQTPAPRGRRK